MKKAVRTLYFLIRAVFLLALKIAFLRKAARPEKIKRILVIRIDRLGDLILSIPLIENLKLAYPEAQVDLLARPYSRELAGLIGGINKVVIYENLLKSIIAIRKSGYDLVVDALCDYKIKTALIALFSLAPVKIGFKGWYRELLFDHAIGAAVGQHMVDLELGLLKPLGIEPKVSVPLINIGKRIYPQNLTIVMHPGGYYPSQRWPASHFAGLIRAINKKYPAKIFLIGQAAELGLLGRIKAGADAEIVLPGLKELAVLIHGSHLFIGNNSGPLHLASALGVPTVSTVGPTDPVLWWPRGVSQRVLRKGLDCSPCSLGRCGSHACLDSVTIEEMFAAAQELLKECYGID